MAGGGAKGAFSLRLVLILGLLSGLAPFCTDLYLPALPAIEEQFNEDLLLFGFTLKSTMLVNLTLAGSMFGIAWGQILMGYCSDVSPLLPPVGVWAVSQSQSG